MTDSAAGYNGKLPPYTLTGGVHRRLVEALGRCAPYSLACKYAGIAESTFRNWRQAAREGRAGPEVLALLADCEKAEAEADLSLLDRIGAATGKSWQAAAWLLERRHPEQFARRTVVAVSAENDPAEMAAAIRDAVRSMDAVTCPRRNGAAYGDPPRSN